MTANFITIDFETGMKHRNSAITVGMVYFENGKPCDSVYTLICPPTLYIRPDFTDIHGLTVDDVKDTPNFDKVWQEKMLPFLEGHPNIPLVAHNAEFDRDVLRQSLEYYKIEWDVWQSEWIDTLDIARKTWTELDNHRLTTLAEKFGIEYDAHNALADAETCGKILLLAQER